MASGAPDAAEEEDEWELCNDDGFVYKRRRRREPGEFLTAASCSAPSPAADPEAELNRNRLVRRKLSLMGLRDRYRREIEQWEGLVSSLQSGRGGGGDGDGDGGSGGGGGGVPHVAAKEPVRQYGAAAGDLSTSCDGREQGDVSAPENGFRALIEEVMLQVEVQESILKKLLSICDIVDSTCDVREEAMMESLLDLPVWGSPRALMSSLSD